MHEMALCTEIADIVLEEAARVNTVRVNEVHLVIGELRDIVQELFDGFFHHLLRGTIAEDAVLQITTMPSTVKCRECGHTYLANLHGKEPLSCPRCACGKASLNTGNELFIASIDVLTQKEAEGLTAPA